MSEIATYKLSDLGEYVVSEVSQAIACGLITLSGSVGENLRHSINSSIADFPETSLSDPSATSRGDSDDLRDGRHVLDGPFVRFLCCGGYFDCVAALIIQEKLLLARRNSNPDRDLLQRVELALVGHGVVSRSQSKLSDLRLLFSCLSFERVFDATGRRLFANYLLEAGEEIDAARLRQSLRSVNGAVSELLSDKTVQSDVTSLKKLCVSKTDSAGQLRSQFRTQGVRSIVRKLASLRDRTGFNVFVGAGISMLAPASAPDWHTLRDGCFKAMLVTLEQRGELETSARTKYEAALLHAAMKPEVVMQLIYDVIGDRLFDVLSLLREGTHNLNHRFIARAVGNGSVRSILTTNFDEYLEEALSAEGISKTVYRNTTEMETFSPALTGDSVPLLKLHGSLDDSSSVVMTLKQAGKGMQKAAREALHACLRERPTLVMGYSGNDDDIRAAFGVIGSDHAGIWWCSRRTGKLRNPEFLKPLGKGLVLFEMNLNALVEDLWTQCDLGAPPVFEEASTRKRTSFEFQPWVDSLASSEILLIVGATLLHIGEVAGASDIYSKAFSAARQEVDKVADEKATAAMGEMGIRFGRYEDAQSFLGRAMSRLGGITRGEDTASAREMVRLMIKSAEAYSGAGDLNRAVMEASIALGFAEHISDRSLRAGALMMLGDLELADEPPRKRKNKKRQRARDFYERAVVDFEQEGDLLGLGQCYPRLAALNLNDGNAAKAREFTKRAINIAQATADIKLKGACQQLEAGCLEVEGDHKGAIAELQAALVTFQALDAEEDVEQVYREMMRIHNGQGNIDAIIDLLGDLHTFFTVRFDEEKAEVYNELRLNLVAEKLRSDGRVERAADVTPRDRHVFECKRAVESLKLETERYRRIVDGLQPAESLMKIAAAHQFLANAAIGTDYRVAVDHARQMRRAVDKLLDAEELKSIDRWIASLEKDAKRQKRYD